MTSTNSVSLASIHCITLRV